MKIVSTILLPIVISSSLLRECLGNKLFSCQDAIWTKISNQHPALNVTPPITTDTGMLNVTQQMWLIDIQELMNRDGSMVTSWLSSTMWMDKRLMWNPADFGNCTFISLPGSFVYLPDIAILNTHDSSLSKIFDKMNRVWVGSDGSVEWFTEGILFTTCDLDFAYYPFDYQTCYIHIESVSLLNSSMTLRSGVNNDGFLPFDLAYYRNSSLWDVVGTDTKMGSRRGSRYVKFYIFLRRKSLYVVVSTIIPVMVLSLLSLSVFCLPARSDEKVNLSVTIFLSFTLYTAVSVTSLPASSSGDMPLLGNYCLTMTMLSALSSLATIAVLRVHHTPSSVKPSHCWFMLVSIVLPYGYHCSCCSRKRPQKNFYTVARSSRPTSRHTVQHFAVNNRCSQESNDESGGVCLTTLRVIKSLPVMVSSDGDFNGDDNDHDAEVGGDNYRYHDNMAYGRRYSNTREEKEVDLRPSQSSTSARDNRTTRRYVYPGPAALASSPCHLGFAYTRWHPIAFALDRVCFYIFLIANLLTNIICLAIIPNVNRKMPTFISDLSCSESINQSCFLH